LGKHYFTLQQRPTCFFRNLLTAKHFQEVPPSPPTGIRAWLLLIARSGSCVSAICSTDGRNRRGCSTIWTRRLHRKIASGMLRRTPQSIGLNSSLVVRRKRVPAVDGRHLEPKIIPDRACLEDSASEQIFSKRGKAMLPAQIKKIFFFVHFYSFYLNFGLAAAPGGGARCPRRVETWGVGCPPKSEKVEIFSSWQAARRRRNRTFPPRARGTVHL